MVFPDLHSDFAIGIYFTHDAPRDDTKRFMQETVGGPAQGAGYGMFQQTGNTLLYFFHLSGPFAQVSAAINHLCQQLAAHPHFRSIRIGLPKNMTGMK